MTKFREHGRAQTSRQGETTRLVLENLCGCVSVAADEGCERSVGLITDRYISLAAQFRGGLSGERANEALCFKNPKVSVSEITVWLATIREQRNSRGAQL